MNHFGPPGQGGHKAGNDYGNSLTQMTSYNNQQIIPPISQGRGGNGGSNILEVKPNCANILYIKYVGMETTEKKIKEAMDDVELINVTVKSYPDSITGHHRYAELLFTSSKALAACSSKNDLKIDNVPIQFTTLQPTCYGSAVAMRDVSLQPAVDLSKASNAAEAAVIAAQRLQQQIKATEIPAQPVPIAPTTSTNSGSTAPTIPRGAIRANTDEERDCLSRTVCIKGLPSSWDVPSSLNQIAGSMQATVEKSGIDASSITTNIVVHFLKDELAQSGGKHFCLVEFSTLEMSKLMLNTEILDNVGNAMTVESATRCAREVMPENVVLGVPGQALIHSVMPGQAIREQKMRISSKLDIVRKMKEKLEKGEKLRAEPSTDPSSIVSSSNNPKDKSDMTGAAPLNSTGDLNSGSNSEHSIDDCPGGGGTGAPLPDRDRSSDDENNDYRRSRSRQYQYNSSNRGGGESSNKYYRSRVRDTSAKNRRSQSLERHPRRLSRGTDERGGDRRRDRDVSRSRSRERSVRRSVSPLGHDRRDCASDYSMNNGTGDRRYNSSSSRDYGSRYNGRRSRSRSRDRRDTSPRRRYRGSSNRNHRDYDNSERLNVLHDGEGDRESSLIIRRDRRNSPDRGGGHSTHTFRRSRSPPARRKEQQLEKNLHSSAGHGNAAMRAWSDDE